MDALFAGLSHFPALTLFALVVSVTFAFLSKQAAMERAKYSVWAFLAFLLVAIGIGWLMYPFSR
jgi:cytochrome bd-type quinol oxidase subunit 2